MENIGHMGYSPHQSNFSAQLGPNWPLWAQLHENPFIHDFRQSFASRAFKYEPWLVWATLSQVLNFS